MGGERQGRGGTGTRWGKRVLVFLANLLYGVKSVLYRLNLPAAAHNSPSLPAIPSGGGGGGGGDCSDAGYAHTATGARIHHTHSLTTREIDILTVV